MKYKINVRFKTKAERIESIARWNEFKAGLKPASDLDLDDFSDYKHQSMTSLHASLQNELTFVMRSLKAIADQATKILYFRLGQYNCQTFFSVPTDPYNFMEAICGFRMVKYMTEEEAIAASNALYWPGGGIVVAEYQARDTGRFYFTIDPDWDIPAAWNEMSSMLCNYMAKWKNEVAEENLQSEPNSSHCHRWVNAVEKKDAEFMSKLSYIKAALPEISILMKNWANWEAEQIIDHENYEDFISGDSECNAFGFE